LFPDNSKGDSKKLDYLTYKAKGNFRNHFRLIVNAGIVTGNARFQVADTQVIRRIHTEDTLISMSAVWA